MLHVWGPDLLRVSAAFAYLPEGQAFPGHYHEGEQHQAWET